MQQKIHFECDYTEGAHSKILKRLMETNMEQTVGYGEDPYCQKAAELIRGLCKKEEAAVHFLVGGTQANLTVISALLRPHQAAVCVETGHINVHETGAIEAVGHKVISDAGKKRKTDGRRCGAGISITLGGCHSRTYATAKTCLYF